MAKPVAWGPAEFPKPPWAGRTAALQPAEWKVSVNSHIGWEVVGQAV